jgi:hypothetical protein
MKILSGFRGQGTGIRDQKSFDSLDSLLAGLFSGLAPEVRGESRLLLVPAV